MPIVCIFKVHVLRVYIHTAWASVLLFGLKAIPEPELAEQQDCSPAFLIFYERGTQLKGLAYIIFMHMKTKLLFLLLSVSLTLSAQNPQSQAKTKVYLDCHVQEFERVDKSFTIQLSNLLREQGWMVMKSPAKADYILTINADTREYNKHITKEETTYTTHKYRDTVLVVEGMYSNMQADSISMDAFGKSANGNAMGMQAEQVHTTVTRDKQVTEAHKTPVEYMYFVYMEAQIQLSDKNDEILYEDVLNIKDGHHLSYDEAARGAAAKTIKQISEILPTKIK